MKLTKNKSKKKKMNGKSHEKTHTKKFNDKNLPKNLKKKSNFKRKFKTSKESNESYDDDDDDINLNDLDMKINKFINEYDVLPQNNDKHNGDAQTNHNEKISKKSKQKNRNHSEAIKKSDKRSDPMNRNVKDNRKESHQKINFESKHSLIIKTSGQWYKMAASFRSLKCKESVLRQKEYELMIEAKQLYENDVNNYHKQKDNTSLRSDFNWIRTVLNKGTLSDKLAAHTLLIQDSAVHNLTSLRTMIEMVNTKGKRECVMAIDNLRELFLGDLLIPNEKLRKFSDLIPVINEFENDIQQRNRCLIFAYFEDQLKQLYRQFLESVVKVSHDTVENTKHKSIITIFDLLVNNPEEERYLLENLVNKLGDPTPKLASQASHFLNQLVNQHHPVMKSIVVQEIERLMYRTNISQKAQYYGLCFLSEMIFRKGEDTQLANKMIGIYFGFFKSCIKNGDVNNKIMSALLSGVTRAFPYSKLESAILSDHLETFYKLIHCVNFNISIQALLLIFNVLDVNESGFLSDRFYCVLYRHILDPQLDGCSRKAMFLNLVYRALKRDPIHKRVRAFIKRLIQVGLTRSPSIACSILILVAELYKENPSLVLSSIKDNDVVLDESQEKDDDEEEEEEKYYDVPLSDDENTNKEAQEDADERSDTSLRPSSSSWVHNINITTNRSRSSEYDPNARNPLFTNADVVSLWELAIMVKHFHPSVSLFAEKTIDKINIDYDGDPLNDFTLKHFLDRFVFRNPKSISKMKVSTKRQKSVFGRLRHESIDTKLPIIGTQEYVNQPEVRVPLEERFIYSYLKEHEKEKDDNASDIESVTSEEFDRLLERYEPGDGGGKDFAKDFKAGKLQISKKDDEEDYDDDQSDDEIFNDDDVDDDDIDFDNDEEFDAAFDDVDDDLDDAFKNTDDEDDGDGDIPIRPKKKQKKGFDKVTSSLFASADKFAELLEQNDTDSDYDDEANNDDDDGDNKSKKRTKKPNFGRRKKKKKTKIEL